MALARVEEIAHRMATQSATRKLLDKCSNILIDITSDFMLVWFYNKGIGTVLTAEDQVPYYSEQI